MSKNISVRSEWPPLSWRPRSNFHLQKRRRLVCKLVLLSVGKFAVSLLLLCTVSTVSLFMKFLFAADSLGVLHLCNK